MLWSPIKKLSNYYTDLKEHVEQGYDELYTGMNLIFQFDKEAYNQFLEHKHPEERYAEEMARSGRFSKNRRSLETQEYGNIFGPLI